MERAGAGTLQALPNAPKPIRPAFLPVDDKTLYGLGGSFWMVGSDGGRYAPGLWCATTTQVSDSTHP